MTRRSQTVGVDDNAAAAAVAAEDGLETVEVDVGRSWPDRLVGVHSETIGRRDGSGCEEPGLEARK